MIHTFSTDLLNQILFAEQSFRSELAFLLERLSSERPKTASGDSVLNVNSVLYNLEALFKYIKKSLCYNLDKRR